MIGWPDEFCAQLAARGFYVVRFDNRDVGYQRPGHPVEASLGVPPGEDVEAEHALVLAHHP